MSISSLVKGLVLQGQSSVAVVKKNDVVYRIAPIEEVTEIRFENFSEYEPKIIRLGEHLEHDYKVIDATVDPKEDDDDTESGAFSTGANVNVTVKVRIIREGKAVENMNVTLTDFSSFFAPFYINHNDTWKIQTSADVNRVTFRCIPVILNNPISFS